MRSWRSRGATVLAGALLAVLAAVPVGAEEPQISDPENDAYRYPDSPLGQLPPRPANPFLSKPAADILTVAFARTAPQGYLHDGSYSVSVALLGKPDATYNYLVGGRFGDDCYLIHFLKAGETRRANAFCGFGDDFQWVAALDGSKVAIKGNAISANFSFRRADLGRALRDDPEIDGLYAMSCPVTSQSWGCNDDVIDWGFASSTTSFRI